MLVCKVGKTKYKKFYKIKNLPKQLILDIINFNILGDSGKVLYFDMPQYIKGRQIKSFGGTLTYKILYRGQGRQTSQAPHIVLSVSL